MSVVLKTMFIQFIEKMQMENRQNLFRQMLCCWFYKNCYPQKIELLKVELKVHLTFPLSSGSFVQCLLVLFQTFYYDLQKFATCCVFFISAIEAQSQIVLPNFPSVQFPSNILLVFTIFGFLTVSAFISCVLKTAFDACLYCSYCRDQRGLGFQR